ncbi:MAG: YbgC/FadM family acyl-CoA thioesterase, partial [Sandaracinaceae bacterium]
MHEHPVQVYYEDTDHSGVVYHANYLKYFERAREHLLGVDELRRLYNEEGVGFVVYKATLTYKEGAVFADALVVRTQVNAESPYRAVFDQRVYRVSDDKLLVVGEVELVCVDRNNKLTKLPSSVQGLVP